MPRVFNFSAGPGTLPEEVLLQAADEMLDWHGTGLSVMEMSHRGKEFISIAEEAEADLRKLLGIPAGYHVLFLQGGASLQFEMIPMNLIQGRAIADYIHTGEWAKKAINAAKSLADVNVAASAEDRAFSYVPAQSDWQLTERAAYQDHDRRQRADRRPGPRRGRDVPALHRQRDDQWSRVRVGTGRRRCAAGERHVVESALPPTGCRAVRPDLCRRAEEYWSGRTGVGDRSRGPHWPR